MGKCTRCGKPCPDNENMCDDCRAQLGEKAKGSAVGGGGQEQKPEGRPKGFIIAAVVAVIAVIAALFFLLGRGDKKEGKDIPTAEEMPADGMEDTETAAKPDEETMTPEPASETAQPQETETEPEPETETEPAYDVTEGGIHRYDYIVEDCTWSEAFEKAKMMGGYLVHINSPEEFDYLIGEITALGYEEIMFRIGGRRNMRDTEYYWVNERNRIYGELVNGPEYWNHEFWMENEPSYKDGEVEENCLDIFYYSGEGRWVWNDIPDDILKVVPYYSGKIGYIVEYEN